MLCNFYYLQGIEYKIRVHALCSLSIKSTFEMLFRIYDSKCEFVSTFDWIPIQTHSWPMGRLPDTRSKCEGIFLRESVETPACTASGDCMQSSWGQFLSCISTVRNCSVGKLEWESSSTRWLDGSLPWTRLVSWSSHPGIEGKLGSSVSPWTKWCGSKFRTELCSFGNDGQS